LKKLGFLRGHEVRIFSEVGNIFCSGNFEAEAERETKGELAKYHWLSLDSQARLFQHANRSKICFQDSRGLLRVLLSKQPCVPRSLLPLPVWTSFQIRNFLEETTLGK
jgi:hypothetical protein